MRTALLDRGTWDLCLDAYGNEAVASMPYAMAQDVASACRLFLGELWYDTAKGVVYREQILGQRPSSAFVKARLERAAKTVPGVVSATCLLTSVVDRKISGQVRVTDKAGVSTNVSF